MPAGLISCPSGTDDSGSILGPTLGTLSLVRPALSRVLGGAIKQPALPVCLWSFWLVQGRTTHQTGCLAVLRRLANVSDGVSREGLTDSMATSLGCTVETGTLPDFTDLHAAPLDALLGLFP